MERDPWPLLSASIWQTVPEHLPPGYKTVEKPSCPPVQPAVHLHLKRLFPLTLCNSIAYVPVLASTWARIRDPLNTFTTCHPQGIVNYRSTKAASLAHARMHAHSLTTITAAIIYYCLYVLLTLSTC